MHLKGLSTCGSTQGRHVFKGTLYLELKRDEEAGQDPDHPDGDDEAHGEAHIQRLPSQRDNIEACIWRLSS